MIAPASMREELEFIRAINAPMASEGDLRRDFDVGSFVKVSAVMLFAGAFDQYTGWNPHNYYLYRNPVDQRWTYIPWDLDVGFADHAFDRIPVLDGWNAAWPAPVLERPLMERLISHPNFLQEYRDQASVILEAWFRPEILIPKLRALYAQIRDDLAHDPFPPRRATNPGDNAYEDILASMEIFIRKRSASARAQLSKPGERPPPLAVRQKVSEEGPKPGPPSSDAPTNLRALSATASTVELGWNDHAEGEVAHVVQRSEGAEFMNAIGQPGPNATTATDRNVQPGKSYRYRVYAVLPTPQGPRGTGVSNMIEVVIPEK